MPDVWGEVSGRLDREQVNAAVATLPDAQREALELAYWAGLSQTEIAERLGLPLGTVKSRVRLALVALRRELGAATLERAEGPP
jgi:RNA polymerase sigma-70 factor (ECF subfamily)